MNREDLNRLGLQQLLNWRITPNRIDGGMEICMTSHVLTVAITPEHNKHSYGNKLSKLRELVEELEGPYSSIFMYERFIKNRPDFDDVPVWKKKLSKLNAKLDQRRNHLEALREKIALAMALGTHHRLGRDSLLLWFDETSILAVIMHFV